MSGTSHELRQLPGVTGKPSQQALRIVFFGMECDFSLPVLEALLRNNIHIVAVVIPSDESILPGIHLSPIILQKSPPHVARGMLPMVSTSTHSIVQLAWTHAIPVWQVRTLNDPEILNVLVAYQPDLICVACFSKLIPASILHLPPFGCINVHPSLLPDNRGPQPLFWTFYEGHKDTGITIHRLTEKLDSGPILEQEEMAVPEGISYAELELLCAQKGGQLLTRAIEALATGKNSEYPQDEEQASYHSYPVDDDYVVNANEWSARHLYNFICGVASEERPVEIVTTNHYLLATGAVSYSLEGIEADMDVIQHDSHSDGTILCRDGWLRVYCK
ncbi:formyl transferase [Dictyobacter vulcani]|uniref:methionyl-tRNA formyltransferase n=1 Tax=Dictyobacter vulcani TaxID=2607529 RepID=A0A5J4KIK5_9CHLR|nr:methionyl-tRNA formyltransferase [Dictyobacter vulcani]GER85941.1 formyl transferase [Dictyobacter vulcani]